VLLKIRGSILLSNTLANYALLIWLSLVSVVVVPLYTRVLDPIQWGLVSYILSLQLFIHLFELGLSQVIPKWIGGNSDDISQVKVWYINIVKFSYLMAGMLLITIQLLSGYLAELWFNVPDDQLFNFELAVRFFGVQLAFQLMNSVSIGYYNGVQKQLYANKIVALFLTLKHFLALLAVMFIKPTCLSYVLAFLMISSFELFYNKYKIYKFLAKVKINETVRFKQVVNELLPVSYGVLIGLLLTQTDKFIIGRAIPVEDFGLYVIVANICLAMLQLQSPIIRALLPKMALSYERYRVFPVEDLRLSLLGSLVVLIPVWIFFVAYGLEIISFLSNDHPKSVQGWKLLMLFSSAILIQSLHTCIYQAAIVTNKGRFIWRVNAFALVCVVFYLALKIDALTMYDGAVIWLISSLVQLVLMSLIMRRILVKVFNALEE
jgi:O-antigen/teichoic acid export membrane protein